MYTSYIYTKNSQRHLGVARKARMRNAGFDRIASSASLSDAAGHARSGNRSAPHLRRFVRALDAARYRTLEAT